MDLRKIENYAIIDKSIIKKILKTNNNSSYTLLNRLSSKKEIIKLIKGKYSIPNTNAFVVATNIFSPAYLSFWSASYFKGYTEQILNSIDIVVTSKRQSFNFQGYKINFIKLNKKMFFGYEKIKLGNFFIFIADDEKLLIDSVFYEKNLGNFDEIIKIIKKSNLSKEKIIDYLKRIDNISLTKKIGFLLEKYKKMDISKNFNLKDKNYIKLSKYLKNKKINTKWRIYHDI
jgi:predicted transcriptional regulator of viral defense system